MKFRPVSPARRSSVSFGDLRRLTPVTRGFGFSRGLPVDRVYIEAFLEHNALAIRGRVLEVGDNAYTRRFGADRVVASDVLHVAPGQPSATIVADLTAAGHLLDNSFDCIICTQTLQFIFDVPAAVATLNRILKPGGVILVTLPGISHIDDPEWAGSWHWSFTPLSARTLFEKWFSLELLEVRSYGNVLTSVAFLHGLVAQDLDQRELAHHDPAYPLLITVKALKAWGAEPTEREATGQANPAPVSIVICCFNQAHFLGHAIESALAQSHRPTEVVVVDDGSSDNTEEVAKRYPGVSYVWQPNAGLAAARNTGLAHTRGEYVIFLDADDKLRPNCVDAGLDMLRRRRDCAFATGHHDFIDIDGKVFHQFTKPAVEGDRYALLLKGNYVGMCAAVLFRRDAIDAVGGFDPRLPAAEDYDLYLRMARRFPVCDHDEVVAEYRRHGAAQTDNRSRMLRSVLHVLNAQKPFIRDNSEYLEAWQSGLAFWNAHYGAVAAKRRGLEDGHRLRSVLSDAFALARSSRQAAKLMLQSLLAPLR